MYFSRVAAHSRSRLVLLATWFALSAALPGLAQNAPLRANFPAIPLGSGPVSFSKPVLADLDGNGQKEIIVGTNGNLQGKGLLYVIDASGYVRAGWPQTLPSGIGSSPAVGDIDGDGHPDIVVGCGLNTDLPLAGGVYAFDRNGRQIWSFSPLDTDGNGAPDHVWSTPALGDIDGDGINDVVFGSWDFRVYALKGTTGVPLPGWPVFVRDTVWSSPALVDLEGDGHLEVVIGSDAHFEGSPVNSQDGGALWVFRHDGTQFPGFPKFVGPSPGEIPVGIASSPAVGDIDGDGCPEIIVGTGNSPSPAERFLYAWHSDGTVVSGWPVPLNGHADSSPALADLNGDGVLDVVVTDDLHYLYAIRGNGTFLFTPFIPKDYLGNPAQALSEPVVAQIGAYNPAIIVGGVNFAVTIVSKTGAQISANGSNGGLIYSTGHPVTGAAVADLGSPSGTLTIVAASGVSAINSSDAGIYAWNVGATGALPWPQFHRGATRDGWGSPVHSCPQPPKTTRFYTLTPCRVSDSRKSGNSTYGGPALLAGEQRMITFTGVCGVPSGARSVALNVTVTNPTNAGDLRLFPGGNGSPPTSVINFRAGQTRANNAIVPLSFDGLGHMTIQVDMPSGQTNVITDVFGYFQ